MEPKPHFRYYYGNEAEQFSFFKIPKLLITHEYFHELSNDAKILYGLLLDRMSLSVKTSGLMKKDVPISFLALKKLQKYCTAVGVKQ